MAFLRILLALLVSVVTAQKCVRKENLALNGSVSQSGTIRSATFAKDGDPRPALMEGSSAQCAIAGSSTYSFAWWQIDLQDSSFKVSNVNIYAPDADLAVGVGNKKLEKNENTLNFSQISSPCSLGIRNEETGSVSALCDVTGQYVTIMKQYNTDNLTLCEVEIFGENRTNLALGKDTKQSSDYYDSVSSLAVDGNLTINFHHIQNGRHIRHCTHTSLRTDYYPWWRVDLGDFFMVKSVDIYNREGPHHTRLHDIEVRVGTVDIAEFTANNKLPNELVGDVLFTKNQLCVSARGKHFGSGRQEIYCSQPTLGRYVSIQIVVCKPDKHSRANVKNLLTLCEVEVYGKRLDFDVNHGGYLSLGAISTSFDNSKEDDEYSWINIDLQITDIAYMIEINPQIYSSDFKMPEVEIRVGNEPITSAYNNEHFTQNELCVSWHSMFEHFETTRISCEKAVTGNYVTFQIRHCQEDDCLYKEMIQDTIKEIKVLGISENVYKFCENNAPVFNARTISLKTWNVAPHKPTISSSIINSGFSSLAVDNIIPDMNSDDDKCALTTARNYSWWRVDLKGPHHIRYVSIHLPRSRSANITADTDLEVRLGNEDISDQEDDSLFTKNNVCTPAKTNSSETRFECASLDPGRYLSVQSKNNLITGQSLQLCEVEVFGCEV